MDKAIIALTSLNGMLNLDEMKLNRELIGSMYPEKFTFENLQHRTARVNEVASIMYQISNELDNKNWASDDKSYLPSWVLPNGLEPTQHILTTLILNRKVSLFLPKSGSKKVQ